MEEHPVAFAMYILSPNSCVISFAYGVSPQPAHAPENSSSGVLNCFLYGVLFELGDDVFLLRKRYVVIEILLRLNVGSMFSIARAFAPFLPGQTFAQEPHPVQSRAEMVTANL